MVEGNDTHDSLVLQGVYVGIHQCTNCGAHWTFKELITPKDKASRRRHDQPMTSQEISALGLLPDDKLCPDCMQLLVRIPKES